ncbi:MAG: hypothetical protein RMJ15_03780 [Nitrososphaerota archaeon]|nr:hypothetical protein [Candidatus Bathyarchaeota archaeon]MDW8022845.1 hypothetical protein [Nitrososphaerota archaeon]
MDFAINEETIKKKLEPYGVLGVRSMEYGENHVYVVHLLSLPLLVQNIVTITVGTQRFKTSSGIIFDSKDVSEKVVQEAEKMMRAVAERAGVTLRKSAEVYWFETESNISATFDEGINKIMEAIIELNALFSKNSRVRDECLHKKYATLFSLT